MSNDATVKFGYDGTELNRGLSDAEKRVGRSAQSMERSMTRVSGKSGGAMRSLGGVSMQVQDIAVQLQSGTKMATVVAQQGSQMLSAFGATGAIVGGLVAVGGAFYTMGDRASETFKTIIGEGEKFRESMKLTLAEASASNITSSLGGVDAQLAEVNKSLDLFETKSGAASAKFAEWFFGDASAEEKIKQLVKLKYDIEEAYGAIVEQSLKDSAVQLDILELKTRGAATAARAKERELSLSREIARIEASKIPLYAKEQLILDARAKSAILMKQAADAERASLDKRSEQRNASRNEEMGSLAVLDLRSRGRTGAADKLERQMRTDKEAERIRKETGASPEQARQMAEDRVRLEDKINRRSNGQRSRIIARPRGDGGMMGGIDEFNANQIKDEVMPRDASPGYKPGARAHRRRIGESGLTGRFERLSEPGPMSFRPHRSKTSTLNTSESSAAAATASRGEDIATKLDRTNELLSKVLLGN
jgi:hypothetical protein